MRIRSAAVLIAAWVLPTSSGVQTADTPVRWQDVLRQPTAWYGSQGARAIADRVIQPQRVSGGWPKDTDMTKPPDPGEDRLQRSAIKGVDYLLAAQYRNGGWPQFFPLRTDYSRYITFNDAR